jgi:formylglycine-generating enzyme required for sulfatase activity
MGSNSSVWGPTAVACLLLAEFGDLCAGYGKENVVVMIGESSQNPGASNALVVTNSIGAKLRLIPAGEFMMGSPETDQDAEDIEKPQHRVRITRPFYLGVTEVTRGQFRSFAKDSGYKTEAERDGRGGWGWNNEAKKSEGNPRYTWQNPGFVQTDDHPVVNVSWNDAVAFCRWLSRKEGKAYRLPTEAEWEYACRAGTTTRFQCGDDPKGLARLGNIADALAKEKFNFSDAIAERDGFAFTAPVGRYNANAWGLFDLHGNVWEWCSDGYAQDYYKRSPAENPRGADVATHRALRGGGWLSTPPVARSALRDGGEPGDRSHALGFRLARDQSDR